MDAKGLIEKIRQRFKEKVLEIEEKVANKIYVTVEKEALAGTARFLFEEIGCRYIVGAGTDRRSANGDFLVTHFFSLDEEKIFVVLHTRVMASDPQLEVESITPFIPPANFAERETYDLLGISFRGHPDPRRLVLPDDWPEGLHPLRKDFPHDFRPEPVEGQAPKRNDPPAGATVLPIGPFFTVLEEPAYFRLFVEGETVIGCDYRGFYNHRGIEKLGDSTLTYNQTCFLAERICGI